jgi:hypothetical protein
MEHIEVGNIILQDDGIAGTLISGILNYNLIC